LFIADGTLPRPTFPPQPSAVEELGDRGRLFGWPAETFPFRVENGKV
jgi:hypothetical protein